MTVVEIVQPIMAPPELVWACLTEPASVRQWFGPHMRLDARPGGGFREIWRDGAREVVTTGRVLAFEPPSRLSLSWADADWPAETVLSLTLAAEAGGTRLHLTHSGWEAIGNDGEALAQAHAAGWRMHPASLKDHAEASAGAASARDARNMR